MSCQDYANDLLDFARAELLDSRHREALLGHLEACVHCQHRLSNQRALTAGLRALTESNRSRQASQSLEHFLRDSYRQRGKAAAQSRRAIAWVSGAAAAGVLIFFGLRPPADTSNSSAPARIVKIPAVPMLPAASVDKHAISVPTASTPTSPFPAARKAKPQIAESELAYFLPLDDDDPIEMGLVVRVQLPASLFGPLAESGESIDADILIGEDGVARAIRVISEEF